VTAHGASRRKRTTQGRHERESSEDPRPPGRPLRKKEASGPKTTPERKTNSGPKQNRSRPKKKPAPKERPPETRPPTRGFRPPTKARALKKGFQPPKRDGFRVWGLGLGCGSSTDTFVGSSMISEVECLLPRRVCCARRGAMPGQHARSSEQAQETTSPEKNKCDKQVSSWRHTSCHTDKNRYYT